jgi:hypothetical protein
LLFATIQSIHTVRSTEPDGQNPWGADSPVDLDNQRRSWGWILAIIQESLLLRLRVERHRFRRSFAAGSLSAMDSSNQQHPSLLSEAGEMARLSQTRHRPILIQGLKTAHEPTPAEWTMYYQTVGDTVAWVEQQIAAERAILIDDILAFEESENSDDRWASFRCLDGDVCRRYGIRRRRCFCRRCDRCWRCSGSREKRISDLQSGATGESEPIHAANELEPLTCTPRLYRRGVYSQQNRGKP